MTYEKLQLLLNEHSRNALYEYNQKVREQIGADISLRLQLEKQTTASHSVYKNAIQASDLLRKSIVENNYQPDSEISVYWYELMKELGIYDNVKK